MMSAAAFAAVFVALYAAHQAGDTWGQTDHDAQHKHLPGWAGRRACARHVATMTSVKAAALAAVVAVTGLHPNPWQVGAGLGVDALSHYWADRRTTLAGLVARLPWLADFARLGRPRQGHDDNPSLGTGAYALDQSWHVVWLFAAALIIA